MRDPCKTCGVLLRDSEPGLYCAPCQGERQARLKRERARRNAPSDTPTPSLQPCGHDTRYIYQGTEGTAHCLLCHAIAAEEEIRQQNDLLDRYDKWRDVVMGLLELGNELVELLKKEKEEAN